MPESTPATAGSFTPDSAKQLPDRELLATHDEAEAVAQRERETESDAADKVAVAEDELKRRGTTAD